MGNEGAVAILDVLEVSVHSHKIIEILFLWLLPRGERKIVKVLLIRR
jgi:hypothetical protein